MPTPGRSLDEREITHVLDRTRDVWASLRGAGVLLTGVTGFVGSWLLETLLAAESRLSLGLKAIVVVRDADAFRQRLPHLASSPRVHLRVGDVRSLGAPAGAFTHVVHSASAATARLNAERPDEVVDIIERGTQRVLEAATQARASRFLQVSSGSIYGIQPPALERIDESYPGRADPKDPMQRFGAAKRRAEELGEAAAARGLGFVSARAFGLIGPRLPLDGQFAIGNFLGDALAGRPVAINGDGTPVRTWMYVGDLAAWCWTLLAKGRAGAAYNVGAEEALTIGEAAERIAALPTPPVAVARAREPQPGAPVSRLAPCIRLAREELGLDAWTGFDDALARTWRWLTA